MIGGRRGFETNWGPNNSDLEFIGVGLGIIYIIDDEMRLGIGLTFLETL